jgi:hypothetical protein
VRDLSAWSVTLPALSGALSALERRSFSPERRRPWSGENIAPQDFRFDNHFGGEGPRRFGLALHSPTEWICVELCSLFAYTHLVHVAAEARYKRKNGVTLALRQASSSGCVRPLEVDYLFANIDAGDIPEEIPNGLRDNADGIPKSSYGRSGLPSGLARDLAS